MITVKFNSTAQRFPQDIIAGETRVIDYLEKMGASAGGSSKFSINGTILTDAMLNNSFDELCAIGLASAEKVVTISETIKTNGAK